MIQDAIQIDNIGPIEHLSLEAREGTITVLRGRNGDGKTTALKAIAAATRPGSEKLESRDGTTGGTVEAFGVTIRVGRGGANRRSGDLVVTAVEDRLSIADFVDPGVQDPVAADTRRLKALVSLAGVSADPAIYHSLVGGPGPFAELVNPESLAAKDPIVLAEKIKRDLEQGSRLQGQRAERLFSEIRAKAATFEQLDLDAEHDAGRLQAEVLDASGMLSQLREREALAKQDAQRRAEAQRSLDAAMANWKPLPDASAVEQARSNLQSSLDARQRLESTVAGLRQQLAQAELELERANTGVTAAKSALDAAEAAQKHAQQQQQTLAAWQQTLAAPAIPAPTDAEFEAALSRFTRANRAQEQGVLIRQGLKAKAECTALETQRAAAVKASESLREAAKSVFDVLAKQVDGLIPGLKLDRQLRIVVPHERRGECYLADLSHGERWTRALDIAVAAFERRGERGVLAIPQEAWEGLDGVNRRLIARHVAKTGLIVFTAEAEREDDEHGLRVEVINAGTT